MAGWIHAKTAPAVLEPSPHYLLSSTPRQPWPSAGVGTRGFVLGGSRRCFHRVVADPMDARFFTPSLPNNGVADTAADNADHECAQIERDHTFASEKLTRLGR